MFAADLRQTAANIRRIPRLLITASLQPQHAGIEGARQDFVSLKGQFHAAPSQPVPVESLPAVGWILRPQKLPGITTFPGITGDQCGQPGPQKRPCAVILYGKHTHVLTRHADVAEGIALASFTGKEDAALLLRSHGYGDALSLGSHGYSVVSNLLIVLTNEHLAGRSVSL